jgi:LmbE family N-acetylglucosaminyl deacetylase
MKLLEMNKVLCLSPHPDDIEISMAGTMLRCSGTQFTSIVCSIGSKGNPTSSHNRFKECENFWKGVGNVDLRLLGIYIADQPIREWITVIEKTFDDDFQGVFIPTSVDSHQEHLIINKVGFALARARKISVIEYRSPSTMSSWYPNLFVDIKETEKDKTLRMKAIVSQNKKYTSEEYLNASHIHLPSFKRNFRPVEQFKILEHSI